MTSTKKDPVLVVLQLSGGNDFMNTFVPYTNPLYMDNRPNVHIPVDQVMPINDELGINPNMPEFKALYDEGKVAVIQGVGYPVPNRSHFRSMDIWHTCEPEKIADEGWLGRAIKELDPTKENVLTGVNFGRGLPRAMVAAGVPVMGHIGLTPQSVNALGGYRVQGRTKAAARRVLDDALALVPGLVRESQAG